MTERGAILQAGFPKSGNYWLFRILEQALSQGGVPRRSFIQGHPLSASVDRSDLSFEGQERVDVLDIDPSGCSYRIGFRFRESVADVDEYVRSCSHVWTHSPFLQGSLPVFRKFDHIIYIIRDPRDVALSMARFAFTRYMLSNDPSGHVDPAHYLADRLENITRDWVRHVGSYLLAARQMRVYFVHYEGLLLDFDQGLATLSEYLGIKLTISQIGAIRRSLSLSTMQTENPGHVWRGTWGKWRSEMTLDQRALVAEIAGPMISLLNYPQSTDLPATEDTRPPDWGPPGRMTPPPIEDITLAMRSARRGLVSITQFVLRFLLGSRSPSDKLKVMRRWLSRRGGALWKLR
jgi:aryl sulfotransferase